MTPSQAVAAEVVEVKWIFIQVWLVGEYMVSG